MANQTKNRNRYVAFDFDGTLVEHGFPDIGEPIIGNIQQLSEYKVKGYRVIIWTCRHGEYIIKMREWLDDHRVPYDWINENPEFETGSRKIYADIYIDDKNELAISKR